jgi:hydrogenase/urease accessory protein HupE
MITKMSRLSILLCSLLTAPAALAHPGHQHAQGWLPRLLHSAIGWDQLLVLFAGAVVALYLFASKNRR